MHTLYLLTIMFSYINCYKLQASLAHQQAVYSCIKQVCNIIISSMQQNGHKFDNVWFIIDGCMHSDWSSQWTHSGQLTAPITVHKSIYYKSHTA
jgi:hypothetical protein